MDKLEYLSGCHVAWVPSTVLLTKQERWEIAKENKKKGQFMKSDAVCMKTFSRMMTEVNVQIKRMMANDRNY